MMNQGECDSGSVKLQVEAPEMSPLSFHSVYCVMIFISEVHVTVRVKQQ